MIKVIIFDMDDTLYDEVDYCKSGFRAVAQFLANLKTTPPSMTAEAIFNSLWEQFSTGNHTKTFNAALDSLAIDYDGQTIQNLVNIYREHIPEISLPADSKEILELLYPKYTLALLTDGFMPAQELKAEALGIREYFHCIIYTEEFGREYWKPSPKGFQEIIKKLNTKAENCLFVADNAQKDFISANQLGMTTVQLVRSNRLHTDAPAIQGSAPKYIISSIKQLLPLLSRVDSASGRK